MQEYEFEGGYPEEFKDKYGRAFVSFLEENVLSYSDFMSLPEGVKQELVFESFLVEMHITRDDISSMDTEVRKAFFQNIDLVKKLRGYYVYQLFEDSATIWWECHIAGISTEAYRSQHCFDFGKLSTIVALLKHNLLEAYVNFMFAPEIFQIRKKVASFLIGCVDQCVISFDGLGKLLSLPWDKENQEKSYLIMIKSISNRLIDQGKISKEQVETEFKCKSVTEYLSTIEKILLYNQVMQIIGTNKFASQKILISLESSLQLNNSGSEKIKLLLSDMAKNLPDVCFQLLLLPEELQSPETKAVLQSLVGKGDATECLESLQSSFSFENFESAVKEMGPYFQSIENMGQSVNEFWEKPSKNEALATEALEAAVSSEIRTQVFSSMGSGL